MDSSTAGGRTPNGPVRGHFRLVDLERVTHGAYRPRGAGASADARLREDLRTWLLVLPLGAVFTHVTAARLRGWELPPLPEPAPVFVTLPGDATCPSRAGLVPSRLERAEEHRALDLGDGLSSDTAAETLLRCARDLALLDMLVLVDAARRCGDLEDDDELGRMLDSRRPGVRILREAWRLSDPRAESAWETVLRLFHHVMDVPVDPQVQLHDEAGRFVGRGDLLVRGTRMVQEYDGAGHRERRQHASDLRRERAMLGAGYQRRGYTRADLIETPAAAMQDLDRALGRPRRLSRLRRWSMLVGDSAHSARGRARLLNRWTRSGPPVHC